ncbi:transcription factor [Ceraceosorus bombacis]|uniref:Transcription factor n=1 Tax=Ceraceosorus bombacis TaxID=401625 RepID=A0A0P1BN20_9BASI|nr:transcription factor [Ceraceosorus bombacis]
MFALTSSAPFVHQHQPPQHHQSTYQQTKLPALASSVSFGGASGAEARSLPPPPLALGTASSGATQSGVLPSPAAHFYSHHYGTSTTSMTSPAAGQDTHSTGIEAESLESAKRANPVILETGNATADGSCRSAPATSSNFSGSALENNGAGEATTIDSLSDAQRPIASAIPASPSILPSMSDRLERLGSTNDQSSNVETGSSSASGDNAAWTRGTATAGLQTNSNPAAMSSSSYNGSAAGNIAPSGLTSSLGGPHANQPGATRLSGDSGRFAFYPSDSSSSGHPRDTHHSGSSSSAWDHTQSTTPITPYGPPPPHSAHSGVDTNTPSTATTGGPYAQQRGSVSYYQPAGSIAQQAHQNFASDRATSPSHPLWAASEPNSPNVPQTTSAPSTSHGYPQGQPRGMPMSYGARPPYGQSVARISTPTYASMATGAGNGVGGGGGPFTAGPAGPVPSYMGGSAGLYHSADNGHGQMLSGPQRAYMSQQGVPQSGHQGYNSQHFASAYGHSAPFSSSGYPGQPGMVGMQGAHAPHSAPLPSDPIIQDSYGNTVEFRTHYFNPFEVKHRRRTTKAQFKVLEGTFKETPKPTAAVRKHIAEELGMPTRAVQIWFQNRRAKAKASAKKDQDKTKKEGAASSDVKPGQGGDGSGMYGERGSFSGPTSASFYPDNSGNPSSHQGGGSTSNTPRYAPSYHPSDGSWRSYQ